MKRSLITGVILLILSSTLLHANEPKTGTLIQFGGLGAWVVFSSYKVICTLIKKR